MKKHTFAICAYKESPYLRNCILSLLPQRTESEIILCTSTPNRHIRDLAEEYDIRLYIREGKSDIQEDWNFAISNVRTAWVTVAHQDDVYAEDYARELLRGIERMPDAVMAFTDYRPMKNNRPAWDLNCIARHLIRSPMRLKSLAAKPAWKKRILSLGNSINAPSCAYNLTCFQGDVFTSELKFALDWDTFFKLAERKEPFLYISRVLVYYRIHSEATSMDYTASRKRKEEELYMFRKFWPEWFIRIYYHIFKLSYRTYNYREDLSLRIPPEEEKAAGNQHGHA